MFTSSVIDYTLFTSGTPDGLRARADEFIGVAPLMNYR
jgi:hypothetical protein